MKLIVGRAHRCCSTIQTARTQVGKLHVWVCGNGLKRVEGVSGFARVVKEAYPDCVFNSNLCR